LVPKFNSQIKWILGLVILLILTSMVYADDSQEVQAEWFYKDLELLYQQGYLKNYPIDWVKSGNKLSRFEIAYYIKQILTDKVNVNQSSIELPPKIIEILQRLITEFQKELGDLGIETKDINRITPELVIENDDGYKDLDQILNQNESGAVVSSSPYYYYGQYYKSLQRRTFLFIPSKYVSSDDLELLDGSISGVNILYQSQLGQEQLFLVIKGDLPVVESQTVRGYYLFPLDNGYQNNGLVGSELNSSVIALLDEVNQIRQIENLWRFEGSLSFSSYSKKETEFQSKMLMGNLNQGLKIGSLIVYAEDQSRERFDSSKFGLPEYDVQSDYSRVVDLDRVTKHGIDSMLINFQGSINLNPQTSVYGGIDLLYRSSEDRSLFESFWPSEFKASAGLNYQMDDYWTVLTYQSFVNSQFQNGILSTTSIGVEYNNWVTLWLAYQMLDFNDPILTSVVKIRF
jgi:hypothetical protein